MAQFRDIWGRCYDHTNFLWLSPIFSEKIGIFLNVMIKLLHNLALFWVKNANFSVIFLLENFFKSFDFLHNNDDEHYQDLLYFIMCKLVH
jgi:hypothetical protein